MVKLVRTSMSGIGAFGSISLDNGTSRASGELPIAGNVPNKSCVSTGTDRTIDRPA